jgi:hypothetical protein
MLRVGVCLLAVCVTLLVDPSLSRADMTPGSSGSQQDAPDFDPALSAFVAALLHLPNGVGPLRSVTVHAHAVTLQFAATVLMLPEGMPDATLALPIGERLITNQARVPLLRGSVVTWAMLAAAPAIGTTADIPLLRDDGSLAVRPSGFPDVERADVAGYRVPQAFAAFVTDGDGSIHRPEDAAIAGRPLREPIWMQTANGLRLVQAFSRRALIWDPATNAVGTTDAGDAAVAAGIIPDGGRMGTVLAGMMVRLAEAPAGVGVALQVGTPQGAFVASWDGARRYSAASVIKLAIMAAYEDAISRGDLSRDPDTDSLEEDMIVYSDNDAANALIDLLGHPRINAVMHQLGMTGSIIGSHIEETTEDDTTDDNYLVPRECLLLMDALVRGDIGDVARIRDLLSRSQAPGSVRDAVTLDVALYEKRGWYDGVENDALLIAFPNGTWLTLAIFQSDVNDIDTAWALFDDLTVIAMTALR